MISRKVQFLLVMIAAASFGHGNGAEQLDGMPPSDGLEGDQQSNEAGTAQRPLAAQGLAAVRRVSDFSLPTTDGQAVSLSPDPSFQLHVLCFLGTECPLVRIYGPRLQQMSVEFADRGVQFIGINSNIQDSMQELQEYVRLHQIDFPVAKDYDRAVALDVGATRTPEVFVVDRGGMIRYQGRIDDQYQPGITRHKPTSRDLHDAISQLLAGQEVVRSRTTAAGCLIALPRQQSLGQPELLGTVTFCDQVIRVLHEHCTECHRAGEIGPFALDEYNEVVGWADMSLEVIEQGRMPPWHASSEHASFANARHMPEGDKQILRRWVDAGMPYGKASQLPPEPDYVHGWRLGQEPDVVLAVSEKPFQVPAQGIVEYQYFVVDPGFTEDKWVRSAQVVPGNSAVVHHAIAFTRPPDGASFRDIGLLSAYVPGQVRGQLPSGYAQRIPAGSRIVFQMHYTPTGKTESDITRLGLVFADRDDVTHEVFALGGVEQDFRIPPGACDYDVDGSIGWFPENGVLLSIAPHMHLRGRSFVFRTESTSGPRTLLEVPAYDFNWQHNYELTTPLPLDQIKELSFTATFDNSAGNPANPDPSKHVTWGDQTWQEMAVTFVTVATPLEAPATKSAKLERQAKRHRQAKREAEWDRRSAAFADRYIARFDANGDQHVSAHELPDSVRLFGFWDFDGNHDSRLSHDEIKAEAYFRLQHPQP